MLGALECIRYIVYHNCLVMFTGYLHVFLKMLSVSLGPHLGISMQSISGALKNPRLKRELKKHS
jgi:hypothetical protein